MYDLLIVTGCSLSTGMEFNDEQLGEFSDVKQRDAKIIQWYKKNFDCRNEEISKIYNDAKKQWHIKEREQSWPEQSKGTIAKEVVNLSEVASSIGKNYLDFKNYLEINNINGKQVISIHQLPSIYRHYIRFEENVKVNCLPTAINFGYRKIFYKKQINKTKKRYKNFLRDESYLLKYYMKIIKKINNQAKSKGIKNFFIFNSSAHIPDSILEEQILIKNFDEFRKKFSKGRVGHPTDSKYNQEIIKICKTIL